MSGARWGEQKPIFEEAVIGALTCAAVGLALGSVLLPEGAAYAYAARLGLVDDPAAYAWWAAHRYSVTIAATLWLMGGLLGGIAGFFALLKQPTEWHSSGMEYHRDPEDGRRIMSRNERALMSHDQRDGIIGGITIGGVQLSRTREVGHISLVGLPGAGKTVLANAIVAQLRDRGDRAIVHDPKGDFTAWLWGPDVVLLGPWDARARWWDIARDIDTPELATNFAGAMFPGDGGPNQFFADAAREALAGLIKLYMREATPWSWDTLAGDLAQGPEHIIACAHAGDPQTKILLPADASDSKMAQGVMAELSRATSWITSYAAAFNFQRDEFGELDKSQAFAIRAWLAGDDHGEIQTVILNNDKNYEVRSQQIFGAIIAAAANHVNSSAMPEVSADAEGLWVVLDEYPQLGAGVARYTQQIEEMGRSRGVRVVKCVQDKSQLFAAVGRDKGEAQRSVQQTRIYAKMATGTASELVQRLGSRDIIRVEFPQAVGAGNKRATTVQAPVIRVDDLTGLRIRKSPEDFASGKAGVELVAHTDDVLVRLLQPFPEIKEHAEKVIVSERWARGILAAGPVAAAAAVTEADAAAAAQMVGFVDPQEITEDDYPC